MSHGKKDSWKFKSSHACSLVLVWSLRWGNYCKIQFLKQPDNPEHSGLSLIISTSFFFFFNLLGQCSHWLRLLSRLSGITMKQFIILGGPLQFSKNTNRSEHLCCIQYRNEGLDVITELTSFCAHHGWHPTVNLPLQMSGNFELFRENYLLTLGPVED